MSFLITFLAAMLVFSAVIAIHELGHFVAAKLCGIQVNEFSVVQFQHPPTHGARHQCLLPHRLPYSPGKSGQLQEP